MRWLHLSDIHFPKDNDTEKHKILSSLGTYLHEITKENKIDYVFITGDLRHAIDEKGEQNPEKIADELKKFLKSAIDITPENVYVVPGNHDLSRNENTKSRRNEYSKSGNVEIPKWREQINNFKFYKDFLDAFYGCGRRAGRYWKEMSNKMHHIVTLPEEANLLLLNTAIFAYESKDDKGNLCVGWEKYVKPLITRLKKTDKQIFVLAHHSPDFLCHRDLKEFIKKIDNEEYNFPKGTLYLCGHTHEDTKTKYGPFDILTLGATCSIGDGVKNQICIGTLDSGKVSYEYHEYTDENIWESKQGINHSKVKYDGESITWSDYEPYIAEELTVKKKKRLCLRKPYWNVNCLNADKTTKYSSYYFNGGDSISGNNDGIPASDDISVLFIKKGCHEFSYNTSADENDEYKVVSGKISIDNDVTFSRKWYNDEIPISREQPITPSKLAKLILENKSLNDSFGVKVVDCLCELKILPLSADFIVDEKSEKRVGQPIEFKPTTECKKVEYHWDFGEPHSTSNEVSPTHTYNKSGPKKVTLTVRRDGTSVSQSFTISISQSHDIGIALNNKYIDDKTEEKITVGKELTFTTNNIPNGECTCSWDFGEPHSTSNEVSPKYEYKLPGEKTVKLKIGEKTYSRKITVYGVTKYNYWLKNGNNIAHIVSKGKPFNESIEKNVNIQHDGKYLKIYRSVDNNSPDAEYYAIQLRPDTPESCNIKVNIDASNLITISYCGLETFILPDYKWTKEQEIRR